MRVYADGSALSRYLAGVDGSSEWTRWAAGRESSFLVTPLSLTELRLVAAPRGQLARTVAHTVAGQLEVVRFSDQAIRRAAMTTAVLRPFNALHLGTAVSHPDVGALATYDVHLARVAAIHGLTVVSPGYAEWWWDGGGVGGAMAAVAG